MGSNLKAGKVFSFAKDTGSVLDIPGSHMASMALLGSQEEPKPLCLSFRAANGFKEEERVIRELQCVVTACPHHDNRPMFGTDM